ncbi:MAG: AMP phosphorylase [Candidatus Kariarchaeaceae archaeon]
MVKILDIRSVEPMVMLSHATASRLKLRHTEVVTLKYEGVQIVATPVVVKGFIEDDVIGIGDKSANWLGVKDGSMISVLARRPPQSYELMRKKVSGASWTETEIRSIVSDISRRKYTSLEVATYTLVSQFQGYDNLELASIAQSMAEAGTQFNFDEPVYDKHSIGGIPGNKITPIIVSIIAAAGLLIPKTSSRAITSPSGTADTMEVLCDVTFTPEEVSELAPKSRGMIVWNAPLNISPLDDMVIDIKRQLGIDPPDQMLASIVSTKIAMGVNNLTFDIPTGYGTKMPDRNIAINFAHSLIGLCRQSGIRVEAALTLGEQPLGFNIGPALEAKEALKVLEIKGQQNGKSVSVQEKSIELAGMLLEMAGLTVQGKGPTFANEYLKSGKALQKFKEIVEIQGGDPNISSDDIPVGEHSIEVKAAKDGYIVKVDNNVIKNICRAAGAPRDKGAGIVLLARQGDFVHEGDHIFTIYSNSESKLSLAYQTCNSTPAFNIEGMILTRIGSIPEKKV